MLPEVVESAVLVRDRLVPSGFREALSALLHGQPGKAELPGRSRAEAVRRKTRLHTYLPPATAEDSRNRTGDFALRKARLCVYLRNPLSDVRLPGRLK